MLTIDAETKVPASITTDEWWSGYDLVVVTPTITNSVSFNLPNHFSTVMAFLTNMSCIPPDVFQGCGRVRHPVSKVVHLYTSSHFSGNAKAVKHHVELKREAANRDGRATPMEKLCYRLSSRANLFSLNFFDDYLTACFRANGYSVEHADSTMNGTKALMAAQKAEPPPLDEVHRVSTQEFSGVVKRTCEAGDATDETAKAALDVVGAPFKAEAVGDACRALLLMQRRYLFTTKLLNVESPDGAAADMTLTEAQRKARNNLWVAFNKDQGPLWAARKAFLYEHYSPGPGKDGMPERLRSEFQSSVVAPWEARFRVLRKALSAVGLHSAVPIGSCTVTREKLNKAYKDLIALAPDFGESFSAKRMKPAAEKRPTDDDKSARVTVAAELLKTVVNAWNPRVTFKAQSRKRKGSGADRVDVGDFVLAFTTDSNQWGEMDLLHSINIRQ